MKGALQYCPVKGSISSRRYSFLGLFVASTWPSPRFCSILLIEVMKVVVIEIRDQLCVYMDFHKCISKSHI